MHRPCVRQHQRWLVRRQCEHANRGSNPRKQCLQENKRSKQGMCRRSCVPQPLSCLTTAMLLCYAHSPTAVVASSAAAPALRGMCVLRIRLRALSPRCLARLSASARSSAAHRPTAVAACCSAGSAHPARRAVQRASVLVGAPHCRSPAGTAALKLLPTAMGQTRCGPRLPPPVA